MPPIPTAAKSELRFAASGEAKALRVLRQELCGEAGRRREDSIAVPTTLLPRLLAFRCAQHVETPARQPQRRGAQRPSAEATQGEELSLAEETPEGEESGARPRLGWRVRGVRICRRRCRARLPPPRREHEGILDQCVRWILGTRGR